MVAPGMETPTPDGQAAALIGGVAVRQVSSQQMRSVQPEGGHVIMPGMLLCCPLVQVYEEHCWLQHSAWLHSPPAHRTWPGVGELKTKPSPQSNPEQTGSQHSSRVHSSPHGIVAASTLGIVFTSSASQVKEAQEGSQQEVEVHTPPSVRGLSVLQITSGAFPIRSRLVPAASHPAWPRSAQVSMQHMSTVHPSLGHRTSAGSMTVQTSSGLSLPRRSWQEDPTAGVVVKVSHVSSQHWPTEHPPFAHFTSSGWRTSSLLTAVHSEAAKDAHVLSTLLETLVSLSLSLMLPKSNLSASPSSLKPSKSSLNLSREPLTATTAREAMRQNFIIICNSG
mmetsp:Transcript_19520/g.39297  ORF Transcript_19520/g.39297 Transcript_19520/m.39297 type:complete len:336 (+) Transcript_19520:907-1914(+)